MYSASIPKPPLRPAASLAELVQSINELVSGAQLSLLRGGQLTQHAGEATGVHLQLGVVLSAVVQLRQPGSMDPLRAAALSVGEAELPLSSPWATSQHVVFDRVSAACSAALHHFARTQAAAPTPQQQGRPGSSPLELLLVWLATYSDLFTRSSSASGCLLAPDEEGSGGLLPPVWRPYQLGWRDLWAAAQDPGLRTALHCEPPQQQ